MNPATPLCTGICPADLVSVIIPAYNAAPFIKQTLDSVFAQTYPHYQVIVVNDGSPDTPELEQVLAPYMHRVIYIKQENRGLAGARNTGLRAAIGSLTAFLDADDIWMQGYLEEQTRFIREHTEYDLVYCNARFIEHYTRVRRLKSWKLWPYLKWRLQQLTLDLPASIVGWPVFNGFRR